MNSTFMMARWFSTIRTIQFARLSTGRNRAPQKSDESVTTEPARPCKWIMSSETSGRRRSSVSSPRKSRIPLRFIASTSLQPCAAGAWSTSRRGDGPPLMSRFSPTARPTTSFWARISHSRSPRAGSPSATSACRSLN